MSLVLQIFASLLSPGDIGYNPDITCNQHVSGNVCTPPAIDGILTAVYLVAGMVAVLAIVIAGFFYITANGDASKVAKAKNTILYAVIGLIVVMIAFVITQFVIARVAG